jgi:eukaryotic-like serine/threonine-protein kinase
VKSGNCANAQNAAAQSIPKVRISLIFLSLTLNAQPESERAHARCNIKESVCSGISFTGEFLDHPRPITTDLFVGRQLGAYRILERIGQGGMGAIYRARLTGSDQDVAIKIIKRGMDTDAILRRFETERRILGALDHPNVASLLDAGATPEGVPYVVMEFISGQPITRYCDTGGLPVRARLGLFRKVCAAVACAHQIQVIHRDIKPENILVTAAGEPKLVDFGIAKILAPEGTTGTQDWTVTLTPVMTPHYASPEQAQGALVTPASDIYSLGVLLYELLTGLSPYGHVDHSRQALIEAICRHWPEPPSSVVRLAPVPAALAASPEELRGTLRGDLDAIVLKSLEKEPSRRYSSVAEFSDDIGRYLEGARPHARRHAVRRAVRGQRSSIAAILAAVLLLAAALGVWFHRRRAASVAMRPAVAVLGFENLSHQPSTEWLSTALTEMLSTELAAGGRVRTVPGELVSRVKLELALPNAQTFAPPTLGKLRGSLGADYVVLGSYLALGEPSALQVRVDLRLQDARSANTLTTVSETLPATELFSLVARSGRVLRRQLGVGDTTAEAGSARASMPEGTEAARNYSEGLERLRRFDALSARDLLRNAVTAAPSHAQSHAALAAASGMLGYDLEARDEARKAFDLSAGLPRADRLSIEGGYFETTHEWDRAIASYEALRKEYPDNVEYGLRLAAVQTRSGAGQQAIGTIESLRMLPSAAQDPRLSLAESEAALAASDLTRAGAAARRAAQAGSAAGLRILAAQARLLESRTAMQSGQPQVALSAAADSQQLYLAAGHRPGVARALIESAGVLTQLGDITGARARYEEAQAVCRTIGDQTCISSDLDSLGVLRRRQGDLRGALEMHEQALEIRRKVGDQAGVATSLYNIGNVQEVMGDLHRAREAAAEALEIRRQLGERRTAALALSRLANIRRRMGELSESRSMGREAVDTLRGIGDRGGIAMALHNLGLAHFDSGDLAQSRAVLEEALAIRRQQHDKNNTAQLLATLAAVALEQDRLADARSLILESIALREQLGEAISLAQSKLALSRVLIAQGHASEAEALAQEVSTVFHTTQARGLEAEAALTCADAQLGRKARTAKASVDRATELLREVPDVWLTLRRDIVRAQLGVADGGKGESLAILEGDLEHAHRIGMVPAELHARLALAQAGRTTAAAGLAADARKAGFLLIARKAEE